MPIQSRAFDTLFLDAQNATNTYKMNEKNQTVHYFHEHANKHKLNVFTQKYGLFNQY